MNRNLHRSLLLITLICLSHRAQGQTVGVDVSGVSFIGLAGASPGQKLGIWVSPLNDPVEVKLPFRDGEELFFDASGSVKVPYFGSFTPDGDTNPSSLRMFMYGIPSDYKGPQYGLAGVFLGDSILSTKPPMLTFDGAALELETVRPLLQQIFFIGDGKTAMGVPQKFIVPGGARKLYVGLALLGDAPTGSFRVKVSINDTRGYLAQIAHGGGWSTSILLFNAGNASGAYKVRFFKDNGAEYAPSLASASAPLEGALREGSSASIELTGNDNIDQGWCQVTGSVNIQALAVFRLEVPGRPQFEASVLLEGLQQNVLLPVSVTNELTTGLAIANPEDSPQNVLLVHRDAMGEEVGRAQLSLQARGHTAFALGTDGAPSGLAARSGLLEIRAEPGKRIVALGLRFNLAGPFTTLPVVPRSN